MVLYADNADAEFVDVFMVLLMLLLLLILLLLLLLLMLLLLLLLLLMLLLLKLMMMLWLVVMLEHLRASAYLRKVLDRKDLPKPQGHGLKRSFSLCRPLIIAKFSNFCIYV